MRLLIPFVLLAPLFAGSPSAEVPLWPGAGQDLPAESTRLAPPRNERVVSSVHRPSITPYLAGSPMGAAVLIAPGGGHRELWTDHEGHNIARWLSDHGMSAFVLKYRLAREKDSKYTVEGEALSDPAAAGLGSASTTHSSTSRSASRKRACTSIPGKCQS